MDKYPAIRLLLRHRQLATLLASALPFVLGAYVTWRSAVPDPVVIGAIAAVVVFIIVRLLIELVAIVVETLMPTI